RRRDVLSEREEFPNGRWARQRRKQLGMVRGYRGAVRHLAAAGKDGDEVWGLQPDDLITVDPSGPALRRPPGHPERAQPHPCLHPAERPPRSSPSQTISLY